MKALNFSILEMLPSLLDKSKTQTIRKAFLTKEEHVMRCPICYTFLKKRLEGKPITRHEELGTNHQVQCEQDSWMKPPRFKVKEKVKLFWNEDSPVHWEIDIPTYKPHLKKFIKHVLNCNEECYKRRIELGTAEITEILKVKMWKTDTDYVCYYEYAGGEATVFKGFAIDLATRDGFKSVEQMFKTLDKMYNLSSPKEFWIYRWRYLDGQA